MRCLVLLTLFTTILSTTACDGKDEPIVPEPLQKEQPEDKPTQQTGTMTITITVGSQVFKADIEDTETGRAFLGKLPLTLDMSELNGNEKYCYGVSLPKDDKYYNSIAAGDLMLYSGNCIVLFYGPAGGYSYTRIGKLASTEGLRDALGTGSVKVSFASE